MEYQDAAIMAWKRKSRFIEGFYPTDEINEVISLFFGNQEINKKNGLKAQYILLKKYVIDNKMIGLILLGKTNNNFINDYLTNDNNLIQITTEKVCNILLSEYFNKDEIKKECYRTPNIEIFLDINLLQRIK